MNELVRVAVQSDWLYAQGQAPPGGGLLQMAPLLIVFVAIFYFLMIRPQQQRDRERKAMLESLQKGDDIVTTGGICGTIVHLSENHVVLKVDDDVTMKFVKAAIHQVVRESAGEGDGGDAKTESKKKK